MKKQKKNKIDFILFGTVMVLVIIGILIIYSASSFLGSEKYGDSVLYLKRHLIRVLAGIVFLFWFIQFDYHQIRWLTPFLVLMFMGFLIYVLSGPEFHGSRRSMILLGKQFQPSEFMKLVLIFYMAAVFTRKNRYINSQNKKLIVHYIFVLGIVGLVFIEPDLGSALVLFSIGFSLFLLAGIGWSQLAKMIWGLIPLISIGMILFPYQRKRMIDFLSSILRSGSLGYQVKQSMIGLANGGITGVGYGEGKQKLLFLPEPFSDFVLSSLGEEFGFIGILILFTLLIIVCWRGIYIASHAPDRYGYLLAGGITVMIMVNALINSGVTINLLPTTGLPFPFISYGGSSLLVHLIGVGILLNIYQQSMVEREESQSRRNKKGRIEN
jgi:cell division protein FtsW